MLQTPGTWLGRASQPCSERYCQAGGLSPNLFFPVSSQLFALWLVSSSVSCSPLSSGLRRKWGARRWARSVLFPGVECGLRRLVGAGCCSLVKRLGAQRGPHHLWGCGKGVCESSAQRVPGSHLHTMDPVLPQRAGHPSHSDGLTEPRAPPFSCLIPVVDISDRKQIGFLSLPS